MRYNRTMFIIRIEHTVPDFESWKKEGFDNDPVDRKGSGVVRYRILRPVNDPKYVMIDLEFNSSIKAEAMLVKLKNLWGNVKTRFDWVENPRTHIVEVIEDNSY